MLHSPHLEAAAIRAAHARIHPVFRDSPQYVHEGLSRPALGVPVIVKVETANPIRSFKGRGTWIAVSRAGGGGEDRAGPAGRLRLGRQLRPGRRVRRPGPRHPGGRVRSTRANRGKVARMRAPRRRGHRDRRGLRCRP